MPKASNARQSERRGTIIVSFSEKSEKLFFSLGDAVRATKDSATTRACHYRGSGKESAI
jgi:hypothetical protein